MFDLGPGKWGNFDPSYLFDKEPDEVRTKNVAAIVSKAWDVWFGWIRLFFQTVTQNLRGGDVGATNTTVVKPAPFPENYSDESSDRKEIG